MIYIHIFVNIVLLLLFDYMCLSFSHVSAKGHKRSGSVAAEQIHHKQPGTASLRLRALSQRR